MTMDDFILPSRLVDSMSRARAQRRRSATGAVIGIAAGLFALVVSLASWAANEKSKTVLWEGEDQWIRIEPQDTSATPNDHPVQLSAEEVSNALGALQVRIKDKDSGTETQRPVFTRPEIANLAPQVVAGLGRADPRQDVVFSTIGSHALAAGGLVKDPGVNAGRVFYQGGKLNVIFGELQSNYRKKNIYGQRTEDFTPRRQGSRGKVSKQKWPLVMSAGIELHAVGGAVRDDWVVIDPAVAAAAAVANAQPPAAEPRQAAAASQAAPTAPAPSSAAAAAPAAASTSPPPPASAGPPAAAASAAAAPQAGKSELEQRLQTLKDLRDKGLISEEAYNAKLKELLSEL
jgi:hypothetical protein